MSAEGEEGEELRFREVGPTDLATCVALEQASYPLNESASKSTLQYRQHQAATFFRCAVVSAPDEQEDDNDKVVGFVCSTRCEKLTKESLTTHLVGGPLLAIHSVVVREDYRRKGIGSAMLREYIQHVQQYNLRCEQDNSRANSPIEKIVLLSKKHLLTFYLNSGFRVVKPSPVLHGADLWYELELDVYIPWNFPFWVVDSFADFKFRGTGNPASVVLMPQDVNMDDPTTRTWMQTTAKEFNLAETAFVWKYVSELEDKVEQTGLLSAKLGTPKENECHYNIRYFTPTVEVPLCGHATLAAASVLFQHHDIHSPDATIVFHAPEDCLTATQTTAQKLKRGQRRITMVFPSKPATEILTQQERDEVYNMLKKAFGCGEEAVLWMGVSSEIGDLLVEVTIDGFENLDSHGIDPDALMNCKLYTRGVIICCRPRSSNGTADKNDDTNKMDFYSRFFAPKAGIMEDPVTGSAHCVLAPYFCPLLDKANVIGHQQSSRGGIVRCTMLAESKQVEISGLAVTTMAGKLQ